MEGLYPFYDRSELLVSLAKSKNIGPPSSILSVLSLITPPPTLHFSVSPETFLILLGWCETPARAVLGSVSGLTSGLLDFFRSRVCPAYETCLCVSFLLAEINYLFCRLKNPFFSSTSSYCHPWMVSAPEDIPSFVRLFPPLDPDPSWPPGPGSSCFCLRFYAVKPPVADILLFPPTIGYRASSPLDLLAASREALPLSYFFLILPIGTLLT